MGQTLSSRTPERTGCIMAAATLTAAAIQTAKVDAGDKTAVAAYFRDIFHLLFEPGTTN